MHSVATQTLAGGTPLPPRTFDLNVQLGPQDGSQQTDEEGPSAVDVSFIQTMPYAGPLPPVSPQFSHPPLLLESRHFHLIPTTQVTLAQPLKWKKRQEVHIWSQCPRIVVTGWGDCVQQRGLVTGCQSMGGVRHGF